MFNIFNKKIQGQQVTFKIQGMHCTSCAMNIDGLLEETEGVLESKTSYAQSKTTVSYDPTKVKVADLEKVIESLEYKAKKVD